VVSQVSGTEVTDPNLLRQLNGADSQEVTDPSLLAQLNAPKPQYGNYEVGPNGERYPVGSPEARALYSPVAGQSFLQNAQQGMGKFYSDAVLGAKQIYAQMTGADPNAVVNPITGDTSAETRKLDAPLQSTGGAKVGEFAGSLPLAFIPGANTYAGAALVGGGLGALQPTVDNESRGLNTGFGVATGLASKYAGDKLSSWLTNRAAEPFLGWNQKTGGQAFTQGIGAEGYKMPTQDALAAAQGRFTRIFGAARSADIPAPIGDATLSALDAAGSDLNPSAQAALYANKDVQNLVSQLGTTTNNKNLGQISTRLRQEASAQLTSEGGNRELGLALGKIKEHVDDLIGQGIKDPALAAEYAAARPQYRLFAETIDRPNVVNSSAGQVNLRTLGDLLQRTDTPGFTLGGNQSPIYNAARFGQSSRLGSAPSPPILQPIKWATYHGVNNPVVGALTGAASRIGAPVAPAIEWGFPRAVAGVPLALSYLEE
jgi:hypothetical protein